MDVYSEFEWRGLVYDATDGLKARFAQPDITAYVGFDPTASSLHVGSLLPIMALARLERAGHRPIAVVGGGTGLIGDPSGKTTERQLLTAELVDANVRDIRAQLARFLDFDSKDTRSKLVSNLDWLGDLRAVDLMRDTGKHFTVNYMLAKESIKRRVESKDGISYTEFSYLLLQAYDFLQLYNRHGCTVQMGGSDQWGNITAGIELIRRSTPAGSPRAYGLVLPLVMTAGGAKFGKTEEGTVWLDPNLTRPYDFYQFWLNTDDRDAVKYLKFFTFLSQERIAELETASSVEPEKRIAQRELAREVTRLVHGKGAVQRAEAAAEKLFDADVSAMTVSELLEVFPNVPSKSVPYQLDGWRIQTLLTEGGLTKSISEATRLIKSRSIRVNGRLFTDGFARLTLSDAIERQLFLLRKGKKEHVLIRIVR